jgi:hypothetical protein
VQIRESSQRVRIRYSQFSAVYWCRDPFDTPIRVDVKVKVRVDVKVTVKSLTCADLALADAAISCLKLEHRVGGSPCQPG